MSRIGTILKRQRNTGIKITIHNAERFVKATKVIKREKGIKVFDGLQLSDGKDKEIIHSGSTIALCADKKDMRNVRKGPTIVMITNSGKSKIKKEGKWKEWGKSYLHPPETTNVVSISDPVAKGYRVLFNLDVENCFYAKDKKSRKVIRFPCQGGLYVRDDREEGPPPVDCCVAATEIEGWIQREIERAKVARKFYHNLDEESLQNMKTFIRSNIARNVPVTTEDLSLTETYLKKMSLRAKENGLSINSLQ